MEIAKPTVGSPARGNCRRCSPGGSVRKLPATCAVAPNGTKERVAHAMIVQKVRRVLGNDIIVAPQFDGG